ncbi:MULTISPECIES: carbohydrate ABC transporter permease [Aneurinibacillus]|jgi:sn-glycerol 3-phosphate transport system permease protein|uniref:Carbohydrate ABC transporter membrane protein 1, CUT1 family n=1 Tax=Aneurinibacillus thermoaerophilus TaxID=143495 RepID=A0A1G8AJ31_ANETH|nr:MULTISPECIES: sugar ABC transporter permease [Aneurinibacillus]AMA71514.1 ABC transporter permease [Aneurinibacillus sp. XH2]MED0675303.1 sugar ABC transporter permease [Aneurinibacillus thermoaerophilus]MED0678595.1 sugar ABC transporter permease [Aneurinibacillus thermoaerophilus]MED0738316.1 sugar ABC transporter permease [Aneurinibacillus thermoaerophilus]MED0756549.1 sugar ABC transporter permease [Aneurinibacillus thermoaerophilus]
MQNEAVAKPKVWKSTVRVLSPVRQWERWWPYVYLTPAFLFFVIFFFYPIGYMIYLSFHDWSLLNLEEKEWVGLANFQDLFQEKDFHQVIVNTAVFTALTVILGLGLAFLLALWLNRKAKIYGVIQGAIFSPHIISLVSISMLWMWMMDPQYGLLNAMLKAVGLPAYTWLSDTKSALLSLVLVSVWKIVGYNTIVFIAGLQSIPKDIYEAAALDRSSRLQTLRRITIPMLSPTIFFLFIINTISSFQAFDTIAIMTQGGPVNSTNMLVFYIYEQGMDFFNGGLASAASVVLLLLVGLLTLLHFAFMSRRVHYR